MSTSFTDRIYEYIITLCKVQVSRTTHSPFPSVQVIKRHVNRANERFICINFNLFMRVLCLPRHSRHSPTPWYTPNNRWNDRQQAEGRSLTGCFRLAFYNYTFEPIEKKSSLGLTFQKGLQWGVLTSPILEMWPHWSVIFQGLAT